MEVDLDVKDEVPDVSDDDQNDASDETVLPDEKSGIQLEPGLAAPPVPSVTASDPLISTVPFCTEQSPRRYFCEKCSCFDTDDPVSPRNISPLSRRN